VGPPAVEREVGQYAASSTVRNATIEAIAAAYPADPRPVAEEMPFSSRRRFSAQRIDGVGFVLGAPEHFDLGRLASEAEHAAGAGRRVLAFGVADELEQDRPGARALVLLAEQLRPDARATVRWLQSQGVELKVLSGDRPATVAAIARDAGISGTVVDASSLPADDRELLRIVRDANVFGRVAPADKRRIVEALRDGGSYVAMVGDGVNDVPALKAARLAIALGTGTQMARAVADVVLIRGDFAAVPALVADGRKILANIQRVAKLFVTKSAFAAFLILSIGLTPTAYPLLPRQLTLAASLTIGIPGFFLALAPSEGRYAPRGFLRELARFALPAGTAAGLGVLSSYLFALNVLDARLVEARTVAVTVLVLVGLYLILALEAGGRLGGVAVSTLCAGLFGLYLLVLVVPFSRAFFVLALPEPQVAGPAFVGAAVAVAGLAGLDDRFIPRPLRARAPSTPLRDVASAGDAGSAPSSRSGGDSRPSADAQSNEREQRDGEEHRIARDAPCAHGVDHRDLHD
jgi:magnesium-transporting ATPase (P-type)